MTDEPSATLDADVVQTQASAGGGVPASVVQELVQRVEDLETQVTHLSEENADLKHENKRMRKKMDRLEDQYKELAESYEELSSRAKELEQEVTVLGSRVHHIDGGLTEVEDEVADLTEAAEEKRERLRRRIAACEGELGLEEWEGGSSLGPTACTLDRWGEVPESQREDELPSKTAVRATIAWENFDEWSKTVHRGKLITSGRLKQFLGAAEGDSLEYSQVYRVMEKFEEKSPEDYLYIDEPDIGKALVKER